MDLKEKIILEVEKAKVLMDENVKIVLENGEEEDFEEVYFTLRKGNREARIEVEKLKFLENAINSKK
jgi:hypothetical protein